MQGQHRKVLGEELITRIVATVSCFLGLVAALQADSPAPRMIDARQGFAFLIPDYNNILAVEVRSATTMKVLWRIERDTRHWAGATRFSQIDYGRCPASMHEVVKPKALETNERVLLEVKYQYDEWFAAAVGSVDAQYRVLGPNRFERTKSQQKWE